VTGELGDSDVGGGLVGLERLVGVDLPLITGIHASWEERQWLRKRSALV
jgi:hypothetical protein